MVMHFRKGQATDVLEREPDYSTWLTIDQAAQEMGVCRRTISNWMASGQVRVVRLPSGRPRIDPGSLWDPE